MIDHYNAFISYKHAELDSSVASDVQKSLERFSIPLTLKKQTGMRKIERIFRDKSELPITSDLSDTISNALENSDYLIVICSPNTAESTWVRREIQYFLKNHEKNKILTVLAGGEAKAVIPEELRYREEIIIGENGEKSVVTIPMEPLACDYRMPFMRARKEELPRLAAALIGCTYDELVRRQRQFKMRRMGVFFGVALVAALAFGGYMFYSKTKIDQNYRESLANQSRYLANESLRLYDNGIRADALHLALASLPSSEDDERPVTAESVKALMNATGAYNNDAEYMSVIWDYEMNYEIEDFVISSDGTYLAVRDRQNNVVVWNTDINTKEFESSYLYIEGMCFLEDDSLLIWEVDQFGSKTDSLCSVKTFHNYTFPKGNERWSQSWDVSVYGLGIEKLGLREFPILMPKDGTVLIPIDKDVFYRVRISDGNEEGIIRLPDKIDGENITDYLSYNISPDGTRLLFAGKSGVGFIGIIDLEDGSSSFTRLNNQDISFDTISWVDEDNIICCYNNSTVSSADKSYRFSDVSFNVNEIRYVQCLNSANLSERWSSEIQVRGIKTKSGLMNIPEYDIVFYYSADSLYAFNLLNGRIVYGGSSVGSIVDAIYDPYWGTPVLITDSGEYVRPYMNNNDNALICKRYFPNDIQKAIQQLDRGVFIQRYSDTRIYHYGFDNDDNWTDFKDGKTLNTSVVGNERVLDDDYMCLLATDENDNVVIYVYDSNSCVFLDSITIDKISSIINYSIIGMSEGILYISQYDPSTNDRILIAVNIEQRNISKKNIGQINYVKYTLADGEIVYLGFLEDCTSFLGIYGFDKDKTVSVPVDIPSASSLELIYLPKSNKLFYSSKENNYFIDLNSGAVKTIEPTHNETYTPQVCEGGDGSTIVLSLNYKLYFLNDECNVEFSFDTDRRVPIGMTMEKLNGNSYDTLFVAYLSGDLIRYDSKTGEMIGLSSFTYNRNYSPENVNFTFDNKHDQLYLQIDTYLSVIETSSWLEYVSINSCIGYSVDSDIFIVFVEDFTTCRIGYFKHYNLEDLKTKAFEMLNYEEFSEEKKMQYGL